MNYTSLMNDFWESVSTIIDVIPKIVYFIFAALCSGIDAMQALVRKLAGLDTYTVNGETVANTDPLTEFVYGILGIGESAHVYKGLNTVFWSLAIFGLIVLVVSTIVAIIKSHYNEDTEGTSVWKYIYTAIKSVLTFALIPVVVVIGMMLSSFVLKTLDNITAGSNSESTIKGIYGADADQIFEGEQMAGSDYKSYGNFDMFGASLPTESATFGGLLFKASAYSCNRARSGNIDYTNFQNIKYNGDSIFGNESCAAFDSLQTSAEKAEYIAYQIDYAFMNCLELQDPLDYDTLVDTVGASQADWSDWFHLGNNINAFSKYSVSVVWQFYNLWTFNFIVAFGGGVSIFGIMISIIVGMMSRLIKGAALFLVYPALLGLAPLDNFKAFKGWATSFMQQILMAIGAIIGLNLLLLLLPYLHTINFFGQGHVDAIVNVVLLIAGLTMAKDFISMVSGFVGGADALQTGDGMKGGIAGTFKRGAGIAGKAGMTVVKAGHHVGKAVLRPVTAPIKSAVKKGWTAHQVKSLNKKEAKSSKAYETASNKFAENFAKQNKLKENSRNQPLDLKYERAANKAYTKAKKAGWTEEAALKAADEVRTKGYLKQKGTYGDYKKASKELEKAKAGMEDAKIDGALAEQEFRDKQKKYKLVRGADGKIGTEYRASTDLKGAFSIFGRKYKDDEGKAHRTYEGNFWGDLSNVGKSIADGFMKVVKKDIGEGIGVDKFLGGTSDLFKEMRFTKGVKGSRMYGENPKSEKKGDDLQKEIAEKQSAKLDAQSIAMKDMAEAIKGVSKATKSQTDILGNIYKAVSNNNQGNNNSGGGNSDSGDNSK